MSNDKINHYKIILDFTGTVNSQEAEQEIIELLKENFLSKILSGLTPAHFSQFEGKIEEFKT